MNKNYDVIVIGAGHAGVEASLATSRLNKKTALINLYDDKIASMPCNPSIGGPAKGIVVREIDALGGEMAKATDASSLQIKLLNFSRGPGVWALRAQTDKEVYSQYMKNKILEQKNLDLLVGVVEEFLLDNQNSIKGVRLSNKQEIMASVVILTTGTYSNSKILKGTDYYSSGPNGELTTSKISKSLIKLGLKLKRFKTGTPPRVYRDSVDLSKSKIESGTDLPLSFSFENQRFISVKEQENCYLIHSNMKTKQIIEENLSKSAMYSGNITCTGPRYCPSFEDKIVRFKNKDTHQIFIEPETKNGDTWYIQGFSTSMPIEIQDLMLKSLPGFSNVKVKHWAYAIEYDIIDPIQLKASLELKKIKGLFSAGQINGTSGYEEAAAQGLIAGINAVNFLNDSEPFILRRDQAYIGIMIDDLINKDLSEPYRLLTSRAEHRLLLRNDNAEFRLKELGYKIGLIGIEEWNKYQKYCQDIDNALYEMKKTRFTPKSQLAINLRKKNQANLTQGYSAYEIIKNPNVDIVELIEFVPFLSNLNSNQLQNLVINIRFEGYIKKENEFVERLLKLETKKIPKDINYSKVDNLATEARQKLEIIRPINIGQASRIMGVNPADIQMLLFYLKSMYPKEKSI